MDRPSLRKSGFDFKSNQMLRSPAPPLSPRGDHVYSLWDSLRLQQCLSNKSVLYHPKRRQLLNDSYPGAAKRASSQPRRLLMKAQACTRVQIGQAQHRLP